MRQSWPTEGRRPEKRLHPLLLRNQNHQRRLRPPALGRPCPSEIPRRRESKLARYLLCRVMGNNSCLNYRSGLSKLFGRGGSTKKGEEPPPQVGGDKPPAAAPSSQANERGPSGEWEILEAIKSSPEVAKKPPPVASKPKPGQTGLSGGEEGKSEHTSPRKMPGMVAALPGVNQELASVLKGVALKQATPKVCHDYCALFTSNNYCA